MGKKKQQKKRLKLIVAATNMGVALGVLLSLAKNGLYPFDKSTGTSKEILQLLKKEYLIELAEHDFETVIELFNLHPNLSFTINDYPPESEIVTRTETEKVH